MVSNDGCTSTCQSECGDGVWQSGEPCDASAPSSPLCTAQCTLRSCGDGVVQAPYEQCDFGNVTASIPPGCQNCQWNCANNGCCGYDGNGDGNRCDTAAGEVRHVVIFWLLFFLVSPNLN